MRTPFIPAVFALLLASGAGAVEPLVVMDAATVDFETARQAIAEIAVPRFGETEMLACAVPAAEIRGRLCVRAEAKERFPFGELRIVEVK